MDAPAFLYFLTSAVTAVTSLFAWHRRSQRGLLSLAGAMLAIAVWGLASALELSVVQLPHKLFFIGIENPAGDAIVILTLFFILEYYRLDGWLTPLRRAAFFLPTAVYMILSWVAPWRRWIWTGFVPGPPGSHQFYYLHGPVYYLSVAYQILLAVITIGILVRESTRLRGHERRRTIWIITSILLSLLPYLVYLAWPEMDVGLNVMPLGMAGSGLLISWIVFEDLDRQVQESTLELKRAVRRLETEIGERQRAEQELRSLKDSLAQRVAEQSRNLSGIYELILIASRSEGMSSLMDESLGRICTALGSRAACLHQQQTPGEPLRLVAQHGLPPGQQCKTMQLPLDWLQPADRPRALTNLAAGAGVPAALQLGGLASAMSAPLNLSDEFYGVLTAFWPEPQLFSVEEIELFSALAKQIALLVENIHLRQRIESAAAIKERRKLARDLHDSVTQSLHSLVYAAYAASNRLRQGNYDKLEESHCQLAEGAQQALKEMRLLLYEMRLAPLETVDLVEALQLRLEAVEQRAGVDACLVLETPPDWPKVWERELYCIAMEALNNSLKHARAGQVRVRLNASDGEFRMEIADDGQGFDVSRSRCGGMGLSSMAERAERLGGRLVVDAAPGCGARIIVHCDLMEATDGED